MSAISSWFPNPFSTTPSFESFISATQKIGKNERVVLVDGALRLVSKDSPLDDEKNINKRTWQAFTRAIEDSFSKRRIKAICERYNKISWKELKASTLPFDEHYVKYFGVGATCVHEEDLQECLDNASTWFQWGITGCGASTVEAYYQRAIQHGYLGDLEDPTKLSGAPQTADGQVQENKSSRDKQRFNLFKGIANLNSPDPNRKHVYDSRLTMAIVCLLDENDIGMVIPAPGRREGEVDYYKVHSFISGEGCSAVALVPISDSSSLKSLLIFQCTKQAIWKEGAIPSVLDDFEKQPGTSGYEACKAKLEKLMQDKTFTRGEEIVVSGYSLGGAHAQRFFADFWDKVKELVLFNFLGIDAATVDATANQINQLSPDAIPPAIYRYQNKGDMVNDCGEKSMGDGVRHPNAFLKLTVFDTGLPIPKPEPYNFFEVWESFKIHATRPMDSELKSPSTVVLGPTACNFHFDRRNKRLEEERQSFGRMYYQIINEVYQLLDFIFRVLGVEYFRKGAK